MMIALVACGFRVLGAQAAVLPHNNLLRKGDLKLLYESASLTAGRHLLAKKTSSLYLEYLSSYVRHPSGM